MNRPQHSSDVTRSGKPAHTSEEHYDREIMPTETAARMEREQEQYKETPEPKDSINTTAGYTVDREGLANNFAVEPEMYVNEPGDLADKHREEIKEHERQVQRVNDNDEQGRLTMDKDERSKGPGLF